MKNKEVKKVSEYIDVVKELTENQVEIAKEQSRLLNFLKENKNLNNNLSNYYQALFKEKDNRSFNGNISLRVAYLNNRV